VAVATNSGCFVQRDDERVLIIRHSWGELDIPGGLANPWESPQTTAVRETWEETGYRVMAKELLTVGNADFHIFRCILLEPTPPGRPDPAEVKQVLWLTDVEILSQGPWRFQSERKSFALWAQPAAEKAVWQCHGYSKEEWSAVKSHPEKEGEICSRQRHDGFVFKYTKGENGVLAPGCGQCHCCKRTEQPRDVRPWQCYDYTSAESIEFHQADDPKRGERDVCLKSRGDGYEYRYAQGDTLHLAKGCSGCWCCRRKVAYVV